MPVWQQFRKGVPPAWGGHLLEGEFRKSATVTRVVLCGVPSLRARIADVAVTLKEGGFSRQAALGISILESEFSDRGSNPREVLCTPALFDELRTWVCMQSWQHPEVFPGGPPPQY